MSSFAGSDSTASTMQSFFWQVLRDIRIYANLKKELDEATAAGKLSEMPQWNEVQNLPYFQACLKEAMRTRPAVGLNISRIVPPEGAEIDGQWYPGGTRVALNGWVLHRDREIFGEDSATFRPERWIEGDAKAMERYMFQVRTSPLPSPARGYLRRMLAVWRRISSLHRQEPRDARDEQDSSSAVPGLQLRIAPAKGGAEVSFHLLRRS